jgi:hypothetical protein
LKGSGNDGQTQRISFVPGHGVVAQNGSVLPGDHLFGFLLSLARLGGLQGPFQPGVVSAQEPDVKRAVTLEQPVTDLPPVRQLHELVEDPSHDSPRVVER